MPAKWNCHWRLSGEQRNSPLHECLVSIIGSSPVTIVVEQKEVELSKGSAALGNSFLSCARLLCDLMTHFLWDKEKKIDFLMESMHTALKKLYLVQRLRFERSNDMFQQSLFVCRVFLCDLL